jgi:nucleoside-diphosphate-sugar epimerase
MDFKDRSVLVVGGAGYVGSVLTTRLLEAGAQVRVLDQLIYDNGFALQHLLDNERLRFVRGDLRDAATFARAADGVHDVVLLASLVGDPICKKYPELALDVNQRGATQLIDSLDRCGVERFVFASTCSNYGIQDPSTLASETAELNPQSLYAKTKIAVEQHLLEVAKQSRFVGTVLRVATAYGFSPRMRFDLTVSQFAWELASSDQPLLVYDAETWRPYCHVRDISKAIMTVLGQPADRVRGEVFNAGADAQHFTKRMIVEEVQKHLPMAPVEYRSGDTDPRNYRVSFAKIRDRLGFECDHTVQRYLPVLAAAVRAGVFPHPADNQRFGNFEVKHLA